MMLAEAPIRRKEDTTRLADPQRRLQSAVVAQEGHTPFEDPQGLLAVLDSTLDDDRALIAAIHRTTLGPGSRTAAA